MSGYLKPAVKGVSWMGGLRIATRSIAFIRIAILARLLTPQVFGVFGIAALIMRMVEIFTETGMNVFLIQEKGTVKKYLNTAWTLSIIRGFVLTGIIYFSSPYVAAFFNEPDVESIIKLGSFIQLIRGFINPAIVRFQKELAFGKEFAYRFAIFTIDSLVVIVTAFYLRSAESFIWGWIVGSLVEVIISLIWISPRPRFHLNINQLKALVHRGKWVTLSGAFNFLISEGDDIVVGRLLATNSLGIYQTAYKISTLPLTEVAQIAQKVTFPVYTHIAGDIQRLRQAFYRVMFTVLVITVPLGIGIYTFAEPIVMIVLGDMWRDVIPVLEVLSIFGVLSGIIHAPYSLFYALKQQNIIARINGLQLFVLAASIIPLTQAYGLIGTGYATILSAAAVAPIVGFYVHVALQEK